MFHKLSLRGRLTLLISGAVIPLAVLAGSTTYFLFEANNTTASVRLLQLSRSILSSVEARVQAITAAAQVLSVSQDLRGGNLGSFLAEANTFLSAFFPDSSVVLTDETGAQVLNTAAPEPLARRTLRVRETTEARQRVFESGRPSISRHFYAPIMGKHAVTINVPVMQDGRALYNLGIPMTVDRLSAILTEQKLQPDWTVAIWDTAGTVIARNRDIARFAGRKASDTIYPALMEKRDQVLTTVTFDGVKVLTALVHSPSLGWSLAVGVPEASITGPLHRALFVISGFSLACLLVSGLAAARLARRVLEADRHRQLLINELNHRVKNSLATVQSIARQTLRRAGSKEEAFASLEGRIMALSRAHEVLTEQHWEAATMQRVVAHAVEPFSSVPGAIHVNEGPDVAVSPKAALAITLMLHELATNAIKYGALSVAGGRALIHWFVEDGSRLVMTWKESNGPPVQAPSHKGFGTVLIERGLPEDLDGSAVLEYPPDGVICTLSYRLKG